MTQIETGNIQLKMQKVPPKQIVDDAVRAVQLQAEQKQVQLLVECANELPPVHADADKTSWVLINLLTNAIKHTADKGSIGIKVAHRDKGISFSVTDTGVGIEEKYLLKIFDRYFKVPGDTTKSSTGLGLAISKEFIDAQGGQISVDSEYSKGSTFSFSLPV